MASWPLSHKDHHFRNLLNPLNLHMASSTLQSPWLIHPHKPIKPLLSSTKPNPTNSTIKSLKISNTKSSSDPKEEKSGKSDPVKLAFEKAKVYKKSEPSNPTRKIVQNPVLEFDETGDENDGLVLEVEGENQEVPIAVKLAMEKAKKYKKDKGMVGSSKGVGISETVSESKEGNAGNFGKGLVDKKEPKISSIDFKGLNFADKKSSRGLPAGLVPVADPFFKGNLPEVEIIVGDGSNFGDATTMPILKDDSDLNKPKDDSDLYKPKVSTWGVFPRPGNISQTYGGGRTIQPGEVLETAEDRAAKEARTRQLLAAYKSQIGLNIDPRLKSECEKVLNEGNSLMDLGKLKEALPFYEKVMDKLPFQSELHGLAALQWSVCQDSLSRSNDARVMYERLQSHPNVQVRKKARQCIFTFQAMEMMKVKSSSFSPMSMGYQNYFEAFIEDKANYLLKEAEVNEGALSQTLPYIIFLVSPIFILLFFAIQKRT